MRRGGEGRQGDKEKREIIYFPSSVCSPFPVLFFTFYFFTFAFSLIYLRIVQ